MSEPEAIEHARLLAIGRAVRDWDFVCFPQQDFSTARRVIEHLRDVGDRAARRAARREVQR